MAAFNKFQNFVEDLGLGVHNLSTHVLRVYLSNATPSASGDAVKADLATITEQNGFTAADVQNVWSESGGTATLAGTDVVWTGSGAGFGPFQYVPLYNDDPTSPADPLICWWDYGSAISVLAGETFTVDFGASIFTLA